MIFPTQWCWRYGQKTIFALQVAAFGDTVIFITSSTNVGRRQTLRQSYFYQSGAIGRSAVQYVSFVLALVAQYYNRSRSLDHKSWRIWLSAQNLVCQSTTTVCVRDEIVKQCQSCMFTELYFDVLESGLPWIHPLLRQCAKAGCRVSAERGVSNILHGVEEHLDISHNTVLQ